MKAARWHAAKDIRIDEIDEPSPQDNQVKIKIAYTGICGSDLHEYVAGPIVIPVETAHPQTGGKAPIVMGHEFSGEVVEIGAGVSRVQPGDKVVVEPIYACGTCAPCRQGHYNLCDIIGLHGLSGGGGGFSPFTVVREAMVHKLPDGMSMEQGALAEPAAVALHAVRNSSLKVGDAAVVFGAGPIGLMVIEALRAAGIARIYAVEMAPERLAAAQSLGATRVFNPADGDVVEQVRSLTGGGADTAFEVTGVASVLTQALTVTKAGGEVVIASLWEQDPGLAANLVVLREKTIKGTVCYRDIFPAVLDLMQKGYFPVDKLVTRKIGLDDIVDKGFETLLNDKSQVKILVKP